MHTIQKKNGNIDGYFISKNYKNVKKATNFF